MTSTYCGIVFDLDGTLIDSAPVVADVLNGMRQQHSKDALGIDCYRSWSSEGGTVLVGNALDIPPKDAEQFVPEFRRRYFDYPTPFNSIYPGVIEMLRVFKSRNIRLAICSNKPENLCKKVLNEVNLDSYFDIVLGGDTLTKRKPDPLPLIHVINEIRINPNQILYVGDSLIDQNTARSAGIDFAFFAGGYDPKITLGPSDISFSTHDLFVSDLISQGKING
ncbi:HAD-IA family hydrolase [Polynucleobacter sp. QLW-P1DATA-2]|uniref:HAD-IA family hydrolase n=1 Tax=Polynucleobacter sp. QLW-P1DATA-2 TaxID=1743167 RepID=UPI0009F68CF2|nr:HAD-IA family hydrolase [Polynucleobacter sp. QLW-P1DATA-2]